MIKREQKRAGLGAGGATDTAAATSEPSATASASAGSAPKLAAPGAYHAHHPHQPHHPHHQPSPFDTIAEEPSGVVQEAASGDIGKAEGGDDDDDSSSVPGVGLGMQSQLRSRRMSVRLSGGGMVVHNSCPIPDLVPCKGKSVGSRRRGSSAGSWKMGADWAAGSAGVCVHAGATIAPPCCHPRLLVMCRLGAHPRPQAVPQRLARHGQA